MLWILSPAVASAAVHTVDPADPAAFADIASALSVASSGDTLVLAPGTHEACIFRDGTAIELVGAGSGSTILEPTDACHSMVTGNAGAEVHLSGLTLQADVRALTLTSSTVWLQDVVVDGTGSTGSCGSLTSSVLEGIDVDFHDCGPDAHGGALFAYQASQVRLMRSAFRNNAGFDGGAIYLDDFCGMSPLVELEGVTLENNSATYSGGAISGRGWVESDGSTYSGNTAASGGAVAVNTFRSRGDTFRSNEASGGGGALSGASFAIAGAHFEGNAASSGGAIQLAYGSHQISGSTFADNVATLTGGAIAMGADSHVNLSHSTFCDNSAATGGAIYSSGHGAVTLNHLQLLRNVSSDRGSALWLDASTSTSSTPALTSLAQSTVIDSSAASTGEAVALIGGQVSLLNTSISHTTGGAGLHLSSPATIDVRHDAWFGNAAGDAVGDTPIDLTTDGHVQTDPLLVDRHGTGSCGTEDLRLATRSALRDAGRGDVLDRNGSVSDIGAFGGPGAPLEDHDEDGLDTSLDCIDTDATVFPGAVEVSGDGIDQDCDGVDPTESSASVDTAAVPDSGAVAGGGEEADATPVGDTGRAGPDTPTRRAPAEEPHTSGADRDPKASGGCAVGVQPSPLAGVLGVWALLLLGARVRPRL